MLEASILGAENPAAHLLARAIAWRGARVYMWKSGETATSEFSEDELTRLLERWVDGKTARLFLDPSSHAVTLTKAEGSLEVQIPKTDRDVSIGFPPAWVFNDRDIPYQQILLDLMYFHTQARSLRDSLAILLPQPIRQLTSTDQVVLSWNHDWPGFGSSQFDEWVPVYEAFRNSGIPLVRFGREYLEEVRSRVIGLGLPTASLGLLADLEIL